MKQGLIIAARFYPMERKTKRTITETSETVKHHLSDVRGNCSSVMERFKFFSRINMQLCAMEVLLR